MRAQMRERARDRGVSSLEWALLTPVLILLILACIQFAIVFYASHIALSAAQSGARTAREMGAGGDWQGTGTADARERVNQLGPNMLTGLVVTPQGDGAYDRGFEVTGTVPTIFPGIRLTVTKSAVGPVECFRPDTGAAQDCEA